MAEAPNAELETGGFKRTLKDLFAGAAGGVAQVLLGQPFDIVKVRLQTTNQYTSAADCAAKIYKNEGALAFYKGTLTPLIGIGACVSVQFGAFHYSRRQFEAYNAGANPSAPPALSFPQVYAAGAIAGLTNTVFSSPIEHVRIRLQTQPHEPSKRLYTGPLDCVRKLSSSSPAVVGGSGAGVARGLYRGTAVTFFREAQAYGFWFLSFEYMMRADAARSASGRREDIPGWKVAAYGGLAGEALWISSYPFDVVKSKMQSDGFTKPGVATGADKGLGVMKYASMRDCFAQTFRQEGLAGFWKGIGPTLLRAMPVSAGTFAV
ncbi:MAG: 37S ribosomal protein, mitochondrial [Chaenotheca gracillima]|nr:MAG: 37S ribosomal protein, mitochondrial [Chaenotheca gracillima]